MKFASTLVLASIALAAAQQQDEAPQQGQGQHYTYLEQDFDYTGKDIANTRQPKPELCLDDCVKTSNCHAFSWNSYNGGTCWLKESKGQALYKVGTVSSGIYSQNPKVCQVQEGYDYAGNDIFNMSGVYSVNDCCDICRQVMACRAYSFTSFKNNTCWFKSQGGTLVAKEGVKSGMIFPDDLQ